VAFQLTAKTRLADHRDGLVSVSCKECLHEREMPAAALAHLIGWETPIVTALPRLRCSVCGEHRAHIGIFYPRRPRGWNKHP
jgi:hypothetical protein